MNLQPLYDVKARLEQAAVAGTGLLEEDFRLRKAAEGLAPLAQASPVFGKIAAGLEKLLAAPEETRGVLLLDVLSLTDAVVYTQGRCGLPGELKPLPHHGAGLCQEISYNQLQPLVAALTGSGGGRVETVRSAWEEHPEFFQDYRILPAVVLGLGDSYAEMADQNAEILKKIGAPVLPLLEHNFEPAGKKEMVRRVEVFSQIAGAEATPWLLKILSESRKDVRIAVITALGEDRNNWKLLLDLAKTERGKAREAVLKSLARQTGDAVRAFWTAELAKTPSSVRSLTGSSTEPASDLVAAGLRERLERVLNGKGIVNEKDAQEIQTWLASAQGGKETPAMLDFWRWTAQQRVPLGKLLDHNAKPWDINSTLSDRLLDTLCYTGPGPLCELCRELWENSRGKPDYLTHGLLASLLTRPAGEVYEEFSPYIPTKTPLIEGDKPKLNRAALQGLYRVFWKKETGDWRVYNAHPTAQPLDIRWIVRLTQAVWKKNLQANPGQVDDVVFGGYDVSLMNLVNPDDPEMRDVMAPYLRQRMAQVGGWRTYSRWLFQLGASPRGALKDSMLQVRKPTYLYYVWLVLSEGAKVLPAEEIIALIEEVQEANFLRREDRTLAQQAFPYTIAQLRAGNAFPEWSDWWALR